MQVLRIFNALAICSVVSAKAMFVRNTRVTRRAESFRWPRQPRLRASAPPSDRSDRAQNPDPKSVPFPEAAGGMHTENKPAAD